EAELVRPGFFDFVGIDGDIIITGQPSGENAEVVRSVRDVVQPVLQRLPLGRVGVDLINISFGPAAVSAAKFTRQYQGGIAGFVVEDKTGPVGAMHGLGAIVLCYGGKKLLVMPCIFLKLPDQRARPAMGNKICAIA